MKRKKPVRHGVGSYTRRDGTKVSSHEKGSGTGPKRPSKVVGKRFNRLDGPEYLGLSKSDINEIALDVVGSLREIDKEVQELSGDELYQEVKDQLEYGRPPAPGASTPELVNEVLEIVTNS